MANSTISELVTNLTNQKASLFKASTGQPLEYFGLIIGKDTGDGQVHPDYFNAYGLGFLKLLQAMETKGIVAEDTLVKDRDLFTTSSVIGNKGGQTPITRLTAPVTASGSTNPEALLPMILQDMTTIKGLIDNYTPTPTIQYHDLGALVADGAPHSINIPNGNYTNTIKWTAPQAGATINNQNKTVTYSNIESDPDGIIEVSCDSGYTGLGTVTVDMSALITALEAL